MARPPRDMLWAGAGIAAFVALLGLTTNHLDTVRFHWDFEHYRRMAQEGLGAPGLVAPFAYRFGYTEPVRLAHGALGWSIDTGFAVVAYLGAAAGLLVLYAALRRWGAAPREAGAATLLTALQLYQARFLLFDVYRPEALAYPLLGLSMLAWFENRAALCVAWSIVGLTVREFCAIPPLLAALGAVMPRLSPWPARPRRPWLALGALVAVAAAVAVPRLLIPVVKSVQSVDFQHDPRALHWLSDYPRMHRRDINLVYCLLSYGLPAWMLWARGRAREAWRDLGARRATWVAYAALVLLLTLYGGTDLFRFVAYLFLPAADFLAGLVRRAGRAEVALAVVATSVFNRLFVPIPTDTLAHYLDFYGGWDRRLTPATAERALEVVAWTLVAMLLRRVLRARGRNETHPGRAEREPPATAPAGPPA